MTAAYPALTRCFLDSVDGFANPRAQIYRTANGWKSISAEEMLRRVAGLSRRSANLEYAAGDRASGYSLPTAGGTSLISQFRA